MNLDFPEGAHVQINIAPAGSGAMFREPLLATPAVAPARRRHPFLMGAFVVVLVGVAFVAGQRTAPASRGVELAPARAYRPQLYRQPQPDQPQAYRLPPYQLPSIPEQTAEIPPAFRQQLQTPPKVTPPPGIAAPSAAPGEDGFGMAKEN